MTSLAPIKKAIEVPCSAQLAFEYYTDHIEKWWPTESHSLSLENCQRVVFEGMVGGQIYEVHSNGERQNWGKVKVWQPHHKIIYSWHVGRTETDATEVEVQFEEISNSKTLVKIEHRHWEKWGEDAENLRDGYDKGWDFVAGECYVNFVAGDK